MTTFLKNYSNIIIISFSFCGDKAKTPWLGWYVVNIIFQTCRLSNSFTTDSTTDHFSCWLCKMGNYHSSWIGEYISNTSYDQSKSNNTD